MGVSVILKGNFKVSVFYFTSYSHYGMHLTYPWGTAFFFFFFNVDFRGILGTCLKMEELFGNTVGLPYFPGCDCKGQILGHWR